MPSVYLEPGDYPDYGLAESTPDALVRQASALIDTALQRPEGLLYAADQTGLPVAQAALAPTMLLTLQGAISAGQSVTATITPAIATPDMVGEVLVLDEGAATAEACVVGTVNASNSVQLASVSYSHSSGAPIDRGRVFVEELEPSQKSLTIRVSRLPIARLLAAQWSPTWAIAYGAGTSMPVWIQADLSKASVNYASGEIYISPNVTPPSNSFMTSYLKVRVWYVAGFPDGSAPAPIKQATADLVNAMKNAADLPANIKMAKAGSTELEKFINSNIGPDTRAMIDVYRARIF